METYELGSEIQLYTDPVDGAEANAAVVTVLYPDGTTAPFDGEWQAADTLWAANVQSEQVGLHGYTWNVDEPDFAQSGTFLITTPLAAIVQPPDTRDLRVMIPRLRRALLGPLTANQDALSDDELLAWLADATASAIFYVGGANAFGASLEIVDRDRIYGAPSEWRTSETLGLPEQTVIIAQGALDYYTHAMRIIKVSERIADEGQEWQYDLSSNLLRDQLKLLQAARDKALEIITAESLVATDTYVSFLAERDVVVSREIEPWVESGNDVLAWADVRGWLWG